MPEAFVQTARSLPGGMAQQVRRTFEAAGSLFSALSGRNSEGRKAVLAAPASEYAPGDAYNERAVWVGTVNQNELDRVCPRSREVQALLDSAAADVRASGDYMDARGFGNKVHAKIAKNIRDQNDPNLKAETSYVPTLDDDVRYGTKGSIRLDVLGKSSSSTVCVYDHKTGESGLRATRAVNVMTIIQKYFPGATRLIMIEVRPKP